MLSVYGLPVIEYSRRYLHSGQPRALPVRRAIARRAAGYEQGAGIAFMSGNL